MYDTMRCLLWRVIATSNFAKKHRFGFDMLNIIYICFFFAVSFVRALYHVCRMKWVDGKPRFFSETGAGKHVPRCVMVDLEPTDT